MKIKDDLKISGELVIIVTDKSGHITQSMKVPNLVVTAGKQYIASRMAGTTAAVMSHMAIGSGTAAANANNTALGNELGRAGSPLFSFQASGNIITATATFVEGVGTGAISEAGIFNASSGGTMLCRTVFPVVNKQASDTIAITWTITIS
jgi:hypothetical protein